MIQCARCGDEDGPWGHPKVDPWLRDQLWCEPCLDTHDTRPAHWPPEDRTSGRDGLG